MVQAAENEKFSSRAARLVKVQEFALSKLSEKRDYFAGWPSFAFCEGGGTVNAGTDVP